MVSTCRKHTGFCIKFFDHQTPYTARSIILCGQSGGKDVVNYITARRLNLLCHQGFYDLRNDCLNATNENVMLLKAVQKGIGILPGCFGMPFSWRPQAKHIMINEAQMPQGILQLGKRNNYDRRLLEKYSGVMASYETIGHSETIDAPTVVENLYGICLFILHESLKNPKSSSSVWVHRKVLRHSAQRSAIAGTKSDFTHHRGSTSVLNW